MSDGRRILTERDKEAMRVVRSGVEFLRNRCQNALYYSAQTPFVIREIEQIDKNARDLEQQINRDLKVQP